MKKILAILFLSILFFSCAVEAHIPPVEVSSDFSGGVFKGPFLVGSTVAIYPLDSELNQTGESYSGDIVSDDGSYDISGINFAGPVELVATGYYYDEITGVVTDNQMTMRAITEHTGTVNINLFTALEYDRVKYLYASGLSITQAKAQAIEEIFEAFGMVSFQDDSSDISVSTANGAELLAVSSMFAYQRSPSQVQTLITEIRTDIADGTADIQWLADTAKMIDAGQVKANLESYYQDKHLAVTVPDFEDELYSLYGTEVLTPDEGNYLKLSSESVIELEPGYGHFDGFTVPPGTTLTFKIVESADYARMYTTAGFTALSNLNEATAVGPGYKQLDFGVLWGPSGYTFDVVAIVNGVETVVHYMIK